MIVSKAFLIIEPERRGRDGAVVGIRMDRIVQTKPTRLGVRDVAVAIELRVDERLFLPVEPEIVVELRDARQIVEVSADVPTYEPTDVERADDAIDSGEV